MGGEGYVCNFAELKLCDKARMRDSLKESQLALLMMAKKLLWGEVS